MKNLIDNRIAELRKQRDNLYKLFGEANPKHTVFIELLSQTGKEIIIRINELEYLQEQLNKKRVVKK